MDKTATERKRRQREAKSQGGLFKPYEIYVHPSDLAELKGVEHKLQQKWLQKPEENKMEKALLDKFGSIIGIVNVPKSQKTIKVCDGYTVNRRLSAGEEIWEEEKGALGEKCNVFSGVDRKVIDEKNSPVNLRELKLSSAKKITESAQFKMSDYFIVGKDGVVDLS